jgi:hypothetical protein
LLFRIFFPDQRRACNFQRQHSALAHQFATLRAATLGVGEASILRDNNGDTHESGGEAAMKIHHVLVEIVILGSVAACVLALLIATLGTAAGAVGVVKPQQTIQVLSHSMADGRVG